MEGIADKEFTRRVKRGTEADMGASGATRIAGSLNYKQECAEFSTVVIRDVQPLRLTNAAELERLGMIAPSENLSRYLPPLPLSYTVERSQLAEL